MWLIRGCFWFPRCFLACVVVSWSLLVASVVLGVCGCFAFVFCSLSDCWRVWLVRGCFWLPQWLLACVVVSWLFLVPSVVAGACGCFVVVSGSRVPSGRYFVSTRKLQLGLRALSSPQLPSGSASSGGNASSPQVLETKELTPSGQKGNRSPSGFNCQDCFNMTLT